ncbi:MAG: hypothetical protein GX195_09535 [Firmicutes bacterium]|jgi:hypothetical protein|nr:hypothetical protein [Bacillota bacterium]
MLRAEISIFPSDDADQLTHPTRQFMTEMGLDYDFRRDPASLNTALSGRPGEVFQRLEQLVASAAAQDQDMIMVVTFYTTSD